MPAEIPDDQKSGFLHEISQYISFEHDYFFIEVAFLVGNVLRVGEEVPVLFFQRIWKLVIFVLSKFKV